MARILFRGGRIYTPTPAASAILIDDGLIVWVGSDAAAAGLEEPDSVVELDGAWLAPAFVDAHAHVVAATARAVFVEAAARGIAMLHDFDGPETGDPHEVGMVQEAAGAVGVDLVNYRGAPGSDGQLLEPKVIAEQLILATRAGAQASFPGIGDAAVPALVEGLEQAAAAVGLATLAGGRHRVEGLEMPSTAHLQALVRFGIVASVTPGLAINDLAAMAAAGLPLAFGSNAPATPLDPWDAVRAAVHPSAAEHALSVRAAFVAHTRGGQRAARCDNAGVLCEGADATFAIWENTGELLVTVPDDRVSAWSTDPRSGAAGLPDLSAANSPTCLATVVRGMTIHDSGLVSG